MPRASVAVLMACVLLVCLSSQAWGQDPQALAAPEDVMPAVVAAYMGSDLAAYAACLAPDFVFVAIPGVRDLDGGNMFPWSNRSMELRFHERMFDGGGYEPLPVFESIDYVQMGAPEELVDEEGRHLVVLRYKVSMHVMIGDRHVPIFSIQTLQLHDSGNTSGWQIVRWEEDRVWDDPASPVEEPWQLTVQADGMLYWHGHPFSGLIVFEYYDGKLTINGERMYVSEREVPPPRTPDTFNTYELLCWRASACESFDEWVAVYEESPLVDVLRVIPDYSIDFDWLDDGITKRVTAIRGTGEHTSLLPPARERTIARIQKVAGYLEKGATVWLSTARTLMTRSGEPPAEGLPSWAVEEMEAPTDPDHVPSGIHGTRRGGR